MVKRFILFLVLILASTSAFATIPQQINFQGRLTKPSGSPEAGWYGNTTFGIYAVPSGGSAIWSETQAVSCDANGIFSVTLGSTTQINPDVFSEPDRYLGIQVVGDSEMAPRHKLTSVGYAYRAEMATTAESVVGGGGISGSGTTNYIPKFTAGTALGNSVIYETGSNVGIGTTTPGAALEVAGNVKVGSASIEASTGKFYGDGSSLTGATDNTKVLKTGDTMTGTLINTATTGLNISGNTYLATTSGNVGIGTTSPGSKLSASGGASIGSGYAGTAAPTNGMIIQGKVGIGTTTPSYGLDVYGVTAIYGNGSSTGVYGYNSGGGTGVLGRGETFDFYAVGPGTDYGAPSSIRWKENIKPIDNALNKVLRLRGVYFNWKKDHGGQHDMGMIAEEVGKVVPEIVQWDKDAPGYTTGMDYGHLTPVLVEAIKEQQKQIETLKAENEALKQRIKRLEDVTGK